MKSKDVLKPERLSSDSKKCVECDEVRPIVDFWTHQRFSDGYEKKCKYCTRNRTRQYKEDRRKTIYEFLISHPCVDCGNSNPLVLEFDHVRGRKRDDVSDMINRMEPLARIMEEIAKCDVRCSNCHKLATLKQFNYMSYLNTGERDKSTIISNRFIVFDYLATHPCVDCGETDIKVLEFDHVRGVKVDGVGTMLGRGRPIALILEEIGKCDVRCRNCHKIKTVKQLGHISWVWDWLRSKGL